MYQDAIDITETLYQMTQDWVWSASVMVNVVIEAIEQVTRLEYEALSFFVRLASSIIGHDWEND
jgi:hypothetical protein